MRLADYMKALRLTDAALGAQLGVSGAAVRLWRLELQPIGPKSVRKVSELTGIPKYELRPDIYDPPPVRPSRRKAPVEGSAAE